jgi:hypothetical protein
MKRSTLYRLVLIFAVAGYAWLAWNVHQTGRDTSKETLCLFKDVTGLPCPSCGTTRSVVQLLHGNFSQAAYYNPFGFLLAGMMVIVPLWVIVDVVKGKESFFRFYRTVEYGFAHHRWISVPAVLIVAANWGWNILKGL